MRDLSTAIAETTSHLIRHANLLYPALLSPHSHSIVPGGLPGTSQTTRLALLTSLMMRVAARVDRSQSAFLDSKFGLSVRSGKADERDAIQRVWWEPPAPQASSATSPRADERTSFFSAYHRLKPSKSARKSTVPPESAATGRPPR